MYIWIIITSCFNIAAKFTSYKAIKWEEQFSFRFKSVQRLGIFGLAQYEKMGVWQTIVLFDPKASEAR